MQNVENHLQTSKRGKDVYVKQIAWGKIALGEFDKDDIHIPWNALTSKFRKPTNQIHFAPGDFTPFAPNGALPLYPVEDLGGPLTPCLTEVSGPQCHLLQEVSSYLKTF